jgi:hypothetical protein
MSEGTKPNTYGNIIKPGRQGIFGLPLGISLSAIPLVVLVVLMLTQSWWWQALVLVVIALVMFALVNIRRPSDGRNFYERRALMFAHRRSVKKSNNLYIAGPTGKTPDGLIRLPGLMARSELSTHHDSFGNEFGLIRLKAARHYTVVLEAYPDGDSLVDQARINSQVDHWGSWLADLGVAEGIVAASVTVETAPDTGLRLTRMTQNNLDPRGSEFAHAVVKEIPGQFKSGSPAISTRIAITFSGRALDKNGTDRGLQVMADEIGNRLPVLIGNLFDTGAGTSVRACTAQDIIDFTRSAYDPTVAAQIEQARAEGGTGLTWEEAGPVFAAKEIDMYFHDRAVSKTWQMFEGPSGQFQATGLRPMLEATPGVLRKRVTVLYRPIPAGETKRVLENDINGATFGGSTQRRMSARQRQRLAFVIKAAEEESQGAGLVRFGVVVTATCASSADFPRLDKIIPSLSNRARLKIRPALGNQDVAFQAGLPLGVVLPAHTLLPDQVRDWI